MANQSKSKKSKRRGLIIVLLAAFLIIISVCVAFAQERMPDASSISAQVEAAQERKNAPAMMKVVPEDNPEMIITDKTATKDDINKMLYYGTLDEIQAFINEYGKSCTCLSVNCIVTSQDNDSYTATSDELGAEFVLFGEATLGDEIIIFIAE